MQQKIRKILLILVWSLLGLSILTLIVFFNVQKRNSVCTKINITINRLDEYVFVTRDSVLNILKKNNIVVKDMPIGRIDIKKIEAVLNNNAYIESANVYSSLEGEIYINIIQRRPIIRVINTNGTNYYIDDKGKLMKFSPNYPTRLLLANGKINSVFNNRLCLEDSARNSPDSLYKQSRLYQIYKLAKFIDRNEFWKAQIEQIYINEQNEIELITLVGNATVLLGDIDNMDEKFENLFFFYKNVLSKIGYNTYRTINLKYKNQIVCSKI